MYRHRPEFYHSNYSVMLRLVNAETLEPMEGSTRPLSWPLLGNLNRLSSVVAKELMLCHVLVPPDLTERELAHPDVVARLTVQQILMRRWVPEKTRFFSSKK